MRRSFYVVVFVSRSGSGAEELSRSFTQKKNATRWGAWLVERTASLARVTLGLGGEEIARFEAR